MAIDSITISISSILQMSHFLQKEKVRNNKANVSRDSLHDFMYLVLPEIYQELYTLYIDSDQNAQVSEHDK